MGIRIVLAGQVPPPVTGQNLMVERELRYLRSVPDLVTDHLYFRFTLDLVESRKVTGRKVLALLAVICRLFRLRLQGRISCLLYPSGGPHLVPLVRDILLLPWCLLLSERTIVHFHAAGVGDVMENLPSALRNLVRHVYSGCTGAIVMSRFGIRDPVRCGMRRIRVVPNLVEDKGRSHVKRFNKNNPKLLYVGMMSCDKGTRVLLRAFAKLVQKTECRLLLVGPCFPPFSPEFLKFEFRELGIEDWADYRGVQAENGKWACFEEADAFIFPTVAPQESFGLVLIEAMMWSLPIVATDWRANSEILGASQGGICFPIGESPEESLLRAIEYVLSRKSDWDHWGKMNRSRFLGLYQMSRVAPGFEKALREPGPDEHHDYTVI